MWAQVLSALLGVWLMVAPAVLGYPGPAHINDRIIGPIVASIAAIAAWEATRPLGRANLVLGLWLVIAPWVLGYGSMALLNSTLVGVLLVVFALVPGRVRHRFGGGWSSLWRRTAIERS
jgi:hypothetical protein